MQRKIAFQPNQDDVVDRPIIDVTPEPVDEVSLRDVLDRLRRRWGIMLGIVCIALAITTVFLFSVKPTYTAMGQLLLDNRANQVTNISSVVEAAKSDLADVPNEVEILKSSILASMVVEELALHEDPEFNIALRQETLEDKSPWQQFLFTVEQTVQDFFKDEEEKPQLKPEEQKKIDERLVIGIPNIDRAHINERFAKHLTIKATERARIIDVEFESRDPLKASKVVNVLMRIYLANQVQYQKRGIQKATERLAVIVAELKGEVLAAEDSVQAFRSKSRLIEAKGTSVTAQQLAELNSQLVQARADEATAAARLSQVSRLLKVPGSMDAAPDVLASPLIQSLRNTEVTLIRERSDLTSRYGAKHPKMIKIRNEIRDLRTKIREEINKIVEGLSNEVAVARAKLSALQRGLGKLETEAIDINKSEIRLRELEREATSKRELHRTFIIRLRETSAREEMIEPTARVVSFAEPPRKPSFPKTGKTLAIATMLSALFAIAAALVLEGLRRNFETAEEVEKITGYRCLGVLPRTQKALATLQPGEHKRLMNPYSRLNQAIQNVRSTLYLANESRHPKTLLVTSALPREGKSTFAMWYATFCASTGKKVLLIDCDFERPKIHKMLGVANDKGLINVFADNLDVKNVIRDDTKRGISFISAGSGHGNASKVIESSKMQDILDTLAWDYDLIVIDSAPVLALTDAHIIAKLVDSTVFVLQWRRTRRDLAVAAARRLESIDVTSLGGFILTQVSPSKSAGVIGYAPYTSDMDQDTGGAFKRYVRRLTGRDPSPESTRMPPRIEA